MARYEMDYSPGGPAGAATQGETLLELGLRHAAGRDGARDLVAAHMCFNLADREGVSEAGFHRQSVAEQMSRAEIGAALRAARDWIAAH